MGSSTQNASTKRRRIVKERSNFGKGREVRCPGANVNDEVKDKPVVRGVLPTAGYKRPTGTYLPPTRESCIMGTTEALYRLTSNDKDKWDEEDEWIVIKVPKKTHTRFSSWTIATGILRTKRIG